MKDAPFNRRDFLRLSGLATAGVLATACGAGAPAADAPAGEAGTSGQGAAPTPAASGLPDVPRERTLIFMSDGTDGQFTDAGVANPYSPGGAAGHRKVSGSMEPLFYYSAFADTEEEALVPWLATGAEYNEDYTELVVNIREGVTWSDGEAFDANDVAFTLNMLIENAPLLRNSSEVEAWVEEAVAVDDLTVRITFYDPRPRFLFSHLYGKFDTGIYWVPEHIYADVEDITSFPFYDEDGSLPVVTGPYNVVSWRPGQQIIDRRDDWWASEIGFAELPEIERIIKLPWTSEERAAQLIINNELDTCLDLRATTITRVVEQNENIITHTGRELPMGYIDWWPTSMWFNCAEPPFNTRETRWAVSYSLNRQQMLDVALGGSGILTQLPFPDYAPLRPYIEAAAPLLEEYPTNEYNPERAAELMEGQGYTRDNEGFWVMDGQRVQAVVHGFPIFNDIGPVLSEQLRNNGFEAEYTTPPDSGTKMADGTAKIMLFGHGGSIREPFTTLDFYTSKYYRETGTPAPYYSRYRNEEYDAIIEEMAAIPPDADNPEYMDIYLQALEIYLRDLIDAPIQQWLHRLPMNTTYWTGWPTEENNYINGAYWHQTQNLIYTNLSATSS